MIQTLLDGLGSFLNFLFSAIGNYGLAIIVLTLLIRLALIPLAVKQIRSMQGMQLIQPQVKALQQKYKGNRQKLNEETMKLYKEHGVNPFSGCLPILAQFPVLIALFAVLQFPNVLTHLPQCGDSERRVPCSELEGAINRQDTTFLGMNMLCSAGQAGTKVDFPEDRIPETRRGRGFSGQLDCGDSVPERIPYYVLAAAMIGTTFFSQRQLQKASPPGASQQQQTITRLMPLLFGVWGFFFPAGLVVYWTTTNVVQIGQQTFMLRRGMVGPAAARPAPSPPKQKATQGDGQVKKPARRAADVESTGKDRVAPPKKPGQKERSDRGKEAASGTGQRRQAGQGGRSGAGGRSGGDRKKRRKR
jgi:YidC/Oxa1 family membrane protein insertase